MQEVNERAGDRPPGHGGDGPPAGSRLPEDGGRRLARDFADVITVLDRDGEILHQSETALLLMGYGRGERVGRNVFRDSIVHPEDREAARAFFEAVLRDPEAVIPGRFRLRRADGSYRRVEAFGRNCLEDREIRGVVVSYCDLASRARAEMAGQATSDLLRVVVDGTSDAIYVKDLEGRFLMVNQAFTRVVGREVGEILGRDDSHLIDAEFARRVMDEDREILATGRSRTCEEAGLINGEPRTFLSTKGPFLDQAGRVAGIFGISKDVTEIKRAEEERTRLAAIVESSEDAIIGKDLDGFIRSWNAGAERIFGYEAREVIGRPIEVLIPPARRPEEPEILGRIARGERIEQFESVRLAKGGREIDVSLSVSPIRDGSGRIVGASKIARDISEQKRIEGELKEARRGAEEANLAKDRFIAALSHELRTPLTPVLATLSHVEAMPDLPPVLRDEVASIRRNVELEARLIDDLLDLTRIRHGKFALNREVVDAHASIRAALEICRPEIDHKGLEVAVALRARRCHLSADPARVLQIFWNLLRNAVKFTPAEGRVSIRTANLGDGRLSVQFADSGIGIEPGDLERIFRPFEQSDRVASGRLGGLGLGLSIARMLVEAHGGSIVAQSEGPGRGSTFTLELGTIPPPEALPSPPSNSGRMVRLLLVEDNPDTLRALSRLLNHQGFQVEGASTVGEALRAVDGERFDLLISDIGLPDGSGLDVMRQVRDRLGLPGIALSGYGTDEDISASREAGFLHHVVKPVKIDLLVDLIHQASA